MEKENSYDLETSYSILQLPARVSDLRIIHNIWNSAGFLFSLWLAESVRCIPRTATLPGVDRVYP